MDKYVLDNMIRRLLEVKGRPTKQVQLTEPEIKQLCVVSREIFLKQPNLLELEAPIKICDDFQRGGDLGRSDDDDSDMEADFDDIMQEEKRRKERRKASGDGVRSANTHVKHPFLNEPDSKLKNLVVSDHDNSSSNNQEDDRKETRIDIGLSFDKLNLGRKKNSS